MEGNRIPKRALYMNLESKRPRGRPRNRWKSEGGGKNSWWRRMAGKSM
jgi:hypothetical protein